MINDIAALSLYISHFKENWRSQGNIFLIFTVQERCSTRPLICHFTSLSKSPLCENGKIKVKFALFSVQSIQKFAIWMSISILKSNNGCNEPSWLTPDHHETILTIFFLLRSHKLFHELGFKLRMAQHRSSGNVKQQFYIQNCSFKKVSLETNFISDLNKRNGVLIR